MFRASLFSRHRPPISHPPLLPKQVVSVCQHATVAPCEGCVYPTLMQPRIFSLQRYYASKATLAPSDVPAVLSAELTKFLNSLKKINLEDTKDAPQEAFWTTMAVGGSQLSIPLFELLTGYCPNLTFMQLHMAILTIGFMGGLTWSKILQKDIKPGYMKYVWGIGPAALSITGLLLPGPLSFLTVGAGMVGSLAMNLRSGVHPPWSQGLQMLTMMTTVGGLLLALMAYLMFHNREKQDN